VDPEPIAQMFEILAETIDNLAAGYEDLSEDLDIDLGETLERLMVASTSIAYSARSLAVLVRENADV